MEPRRPAGHTVLLVEDDPEIRNILAEVLQCEGFAVLTAANGLEALDYLRRADPRPCIVLCDIMMPIMTGWELRQAMEADPDLEVIPTVAVSALSSLQHASIKFTAYVPKPVDLPALIDIMERHCERHAGG